MARTYGKAYSSMWADDEHFLSLSKDAKLAYNYLIAQGDMGQAGVIALRVNPWARDMSMTADEARAALRELHTERFVVIDTDEMLLLVRSLIRRDGVHKQPNVFKAAVEQIYNTRSMPIRRVLLSELERLNSAEFKGDTELLRAQVVAWLRKSCENPPPNPKGKGSGKGSDFDGEEPAESERDFALIAGGKGSGKGSVEGSANPQRAHAPDRARVSPTPTPTTTTTAGAEPTSPAQLSLVPDLAPAPPSPHAPDKSETQGQQINRIARTYTDRVKLSKWEAVQGVVRAAVKATNDDGRPIYTEQQIIDGLQKLIGENRAVTKDALRIAMQGAPIPSPRSSVEQRVFGTLQTAEALARRLGELPAAIDGFPTINSLPSGGFAS